MVKNELGDATFSSSFLPSILPISRRFEVRTCFSVLDLVETMAESVPKLKLASGYVGFMLGILKWCNMA
jgi:hypothetical protein